MTEDEELQSVADGAERACSALGWVPLKVVVLAEVLTEDGAREVAVAISRDMRSFETLGLLHFAIARENAGIAAEFQGSD